jgi:hypothetical protein
MEEASQIWHTLNEDLYHILPPGYHMQYIFDEHDRPIPTEDTRLAHNLLCDAEKRRVALTNIRFRGIGVEISTVFTVYNYDHSFSRFPVLWETMTFTSDCARVDQWQDRYRCREAAEQGHREMIREVLKELKRHPRSTRRMKVAARRKMRCV